MVRNKINSDIEMTAGVKPKGHVNLAFEGDNPSVTSTAVTGLRNSDAESITSKTANRWSKNPKIIVMADEDLYGKIADINRDIKETKCDIFKNLFVLSFAFNILFTAFLSLSNLESSVNSESGLGTLSLSVIYVMLVLSSVFVPSAMIKWLGLKRTMVVCTLLFCPYFAANIYPQWYTLLPASTLLGLAAAPLWTANCGYITELARNYESVIGESISTVLVRFFSLFFMFFQTSQIWGNLISYGIFDKASDEELHKLQSRPAVQSPSTDILNTSSLSTTTTTSKERRCGLSFSGTYEADDLSSFVSDEAHQRVISYEMLQLCTIFSVCCVIAAVIIGVWLDPLGKETEERGGGGGKGENKSSSSSSIFSFKVLKETAEQAKNPLQMALIPLTVFSGLEQAFIFGDFTSSFVTCYWGVAYVGCVMIVFGLVNALSCSLLALGPLTRLTGRKTIVSSGFCLTGSAIAIMFFWRMEEKYLSRSSLIFLVVSLWGAGDAVWKTQITGLYGDLFRDRRDAAYSCYRLYESLGFSVAFAYSGYLRPDCKLFIVLAFLIAGFLGYAIVEIKVKAPAPEPTSREDITTTKTMTTTRTTRAVHHQPSSDDS